MTKYYSRPEDAIHLQANFLNAAYDGNDEEVLEIMSDPEFELPSDTLETLDQNLSKNKFMSIIETITKHPSYDKKSLN